MGKNGDFCSRKGLNNRSKGVLKRENGCRKSICLLCFGVGAMIYLAIGISCLMRGRNAMKINADFEHDTIDRAYDSCSVPFYTQKEGTEDEKAWNDILIGAECTGSGCPTTGTNWTTVWLFNGATMFL